MTFKYPLEKDTLIECRRGFQSVEMKWSRLAFEFIGSKNKETLETLYNALRTDGKVLWDGYLLTNKATA
jgi:hypothetical protein